MASLTTTTTGAKRLASTPASAKAVIPGVPPSLLFVLSVVFSLVPLSCLFHSFFVLPLLPPFVWGFISLLGSFYFAVWGFARLFRLDVSGVGNQPVKLNFFKGLQEKAPNVRNDGCVEWSMVYYDMVTDWYESFWGQSFQLGNAQGFQGEPFAERGRRHDYWFANRAGIKKGQNWIDMGCGVGGPLRNIIRFTEANVTGVNFNGYQLKRAELHLKESGLEKLGRFVFCDMTKASEKFEAASVDGVYALESCCHVQNKQAMYKEFFKILKPGGTFACMEWVLTDKFNPDNDTHRYCKRSVERFAAVTELLTTKEVMSNIREAGFEVLEEDDLSMHTETFPDTWWEKFFPSWNPIKWPITPLGVRAVQYLLRVTEALSIVAEGSAEAHRTVTSGLEGTALSGKLAVFTPHYFIRSCKPL